MDLSGFFPEGVVAFFTDERQGLNALSENELLLTETYGVKRLADFCTGRYCLRKCTERYGYAGDILIGEKGMPLLPDRISASLSHSKNLCGAVAGRRDSYLSLGLDIETLGRVKTDMWYLLFTEQEIRFLNGMHDEQQKLYATTFFSLKEAFYKLQYPLSGIYLDFLEVKVEIVNDRFFVKTLREVGDVFSKGQSVEGTMTCRQGEVITFCSLPAN